MRTQPEALRLAVATLYIRVRDTRRRRDTLLADLGAESHAYLAADAAATEAWNGFLSVQTSIYNQRLRHETPKSMLNMVARRSQLKQKQKAA